MPSSAKELPRKLDDWLQTFLLATDYAEPCELFRMWVGVSVIAAALERKVWYQWDDQLFPNMYVILVGPPASRKGTAMRLGREILSPYDESIKLTSDAPTMQALIEEMRAAKGTLTNPETGEESEHCSVTAFCPELHIFFRDCDPMFLSALCDWFDSRPVWTYSTRGHGKEKIINMYFNLLGATTPQHLKNVMDLNAIGGGLSSRMIFVYAGARGKVSAFPFATPEQDTLKEGLIHDLGMIHLMRGQFRITDDVLEFYSNWYHNSVENPPNIGYGFEHYIDRRATHLHKLTMIVSASRNSDLTIELEDMQRAVKMLEETEKYMAQAFSSLGRYELYDVLQRIMRDIAIYKKIMFKDLYTMHVQDVSPKQMAEIVEGLSKMGCINQVSTKGGTEIHFVKNPEKGFKS